MNSQSVQYTVRDALVKYDMTQPIINFIKNECVIKFVSSKVNNKRDTVLIYHKSTDSLICEVEVEIIGKYCAQKEGAEVGIWEWAWSDTTLKTSNIHYSKELLLYGIKLDVSEEYYKKMLITSRGIINDAIQLDIMISIARNFVKIPGNIIYPDTSYSDNKMTIVTYYLFIPNDDFKQFVSIITKI